MQSVLQELDKGCAVDGALIIERQAEGFGDVSKPRLALMASQVADAFATKGRINPDAVWNGSYLPTAAERSVFPKK